ncbi:MAG: transcription termination factor NusA [Patescibacteria group bacterium]
MSDLSNAIKNICEEKGLSFESVIATIEQALGAAYRKDFGQKNQNIKVEFDPETSNSKIFDIKTVVEDLPEEEDEDDEDSDDSGKVEEKKEDKEDVETDNKTIKHKNTKTQTKDEKGEEKTIKEGGKFKEAAKAESDEEERKFNPKTEIQLSDAKLIKKTAKIGDEIKTKLEVPESYGRMAAQTAKQVIIQRLREAEREMIFNEFKEKEKEVISGVIQRHESRAVLVDIGKTVGYLASEEQIPGERYNPGERIKVYIKEVRLGSKGAEVVLSRTSDEILKKIFYLEIPEISNGLVELKAVAREAGSRSKVAVYTETENVDPIGSCVGQRGARIQTIISELGGEKVDIILYDESPIKFIANALSPAKILNIELNEKERKATVKVLADQLSLAIGKSGQNARLAARLTGWRIDIVGEKKEEIKKDEEKKDSVEKENTKTVKQENTGGDKVKDDNKKKEEAKTKKKIEDKRMDGKKKDEKDEKKKDNKSKDEKTEEKKEMIDKKKEVKKAEKKEKKEKKDGKN